MVTSRDGCGLELPWRVPVPVYCVLSADAVPGIALGCNCSVLFPLSVFVLFSGLGSSWECTLFGMSRKSVCIAARHRKQSPRAQNDDVVDGSAVLWCSCRRPQGDQFMIECDLRGENCFHWYHGNCVGITPVDGRHMESQDDPFICPFCTTVPCLPPFSASNVPNFTWGSTAITGPTFCEKIHQAYESIVHWKHNLFLVPYGSAGSHFVTELAKLYESFWLCLCYGMYCFESCHGATCSTSPEASHVFQVSWRYQVSWMPFASLAWGWYWCFACWRPHHTAASTTFSSHPSSWQFSHICSPGLPRKDKAAMRFLTEQSRGSFLPLSTTVKESTVFDELVKKHPDPFPATPLSLINPGTTDLQSCHPVIFDCLDGDLIRHTAVCLERCAGPSGVHALGWRRLCTSFWTASSDLCHALVLVARCISTSFTDPEALQPLFNCQLIALDKNPVVRPIGIGETSRRIIAKVVLHIVKQDVMDAAGRLQLCAGQRAGCEASVHATREIFALRVFCWLMFLLHSTPSTIVQLS